MIVCGSGGIGKSALLAKWYDTRKGHIDRELYYFRSPTSGGFSNVWEAVMEELHRVYGWVLPPEKRRLTPREVLVNFLNQATSPMVILVDGNNDSRLDYQDVLEKLSPLVKIVVTEQETRGYRRSCCREKHRYIDTLELGEIDRKTIRMASKQYLADYGKKLGPTQLTNIVHGNLSGNPGILMNMLNEIRLYSSFENLAFFTERRWIQEVPGASKMFQHLMKVKPNTPEFESDWLYDDIGVR